MLKVGLDRAPADEQALGDLSIGAALGPGGPA